MPGFGAGVFGGGPFDAPEAICEVAFATDPAATPTWTDVSQWLQGFSIQRGRQQELDRMEAGTARILLDNLDRRFDPSNAASPYSPNVVPMRRVRLSALFNGVTYRLFTGYAETWPPTYPTELDSNVEVSATDAFKIFNLKFLNTTYAQQLTSARVSAVLNDIGWPAGDRSIATGDSSIQAVTLVNESALQHLQDTVDVENGLLFMTGDGIAKFVNRGALILAPYTTSQGVFGDGGGSEMLFRKIEFDYSDVQLWNEVRFTRVGGTEQIASDSSSQTRYYARTLSRSGLLMINDPDALAAAQWVRDHFKAPALRVQRLVLDGEASPTALYPQMFGREIGDRVTVRKTPPGGGARIEQVGRIEHLEHTWSVQDGWLTAWQLSPADLQLYWVLEHATQGLLGSTTVLAF